MDAAESHLSLGEIECASVHKASSRKFSASASSSTPKFYTIRFHDKNFRFNDCIYSNGINT